MSGVWFLNILQSVKLSTTFLQSFRSNFERLICFTDTLRPLSSSHALLKRHPWGWSHLIGDFSTPFAETVSSLKRLDFQTMFGENDPKCKTGHAAVSVLLDGTAFKQLLPQGPLWPAWPSLNKAWSLSESHNTSFSASWMSSKLYHHVAILLKVLVRFFFFFCLCGQATFF